MVDLAESSRPIDQITLIEELERHKELEAIGDVAYVSSLVVGVPDRPSIEHYVKIVRDKAMLRGLISASNTAIARASEQSDPAEDVLSDAEAAIFQLSEKRIGRGFLGIQEIVKESFGSVDALLQRSQRITDGLLLHDRIFQPATNAGVIHVVLFASENKMIFVKEAENAMAPMLLERYGAAAANQPAAKAAPLIS